MSSTPGWWWNLNYFWEVWSKSEKYLIAIDWDRCLLVTIFTILTAAVLTVYIGVDGWGLPTSTRMNRVMRVFSCSQKGTKFHLSGERCNNFQNCAYNSHITVELGWFAVLGHDAKEETSCTTSFFSRKYAAKYCQSEFWVCCWRCGNECLYLDWWACYWDY